MMTEEVKDLLRKRGLNPDNFHDEGVDLSKYDLTKGTPMPTESSGFGAFGRGIKRAIGPTLGSIAGGVASGAGIGALTVNPLLIGAGVIAGGIAGGIGGSEAQSRLAPPNAIDIAQEQLDQQQHPYLSLAGQLAPQAAVFGPGSVGGAIRGGSALVRGLTPLTRDAQALANVGMGATIGGVTGVVDPLVRGERPTLGGISESVGMGALLNKPTRLGQMMGFHAPNEQGEVQTAEIPQKATEDFAVRNAYLQQAEGINQPTRLTPELLDQTLVKQTDKIDPSKMLLGDTTINQSLKAAEDINKPANLGEFVQEQFKPADVGIKAKDTLLADMGHVNDAVENYIWKGVKHPEKKVTNLGDETPQIVNAKPLETPSFEKSIPREDLTRSGLELGARGKSAEEISRPLENPPKKEQGFLGGNEPTKVEAPSKELKSTKQLANEGHSNKGLQVKYGPREGAFVNLEGNKDFSMPKEIVDKRKIPSIAQIDRIEHIGSPTAKYVAGKLKTFYENQRSNYGKFVNESIGVIRDSFSGIKETLLNHSESLKRVDQFLIDQKRGVESSIQLTPKEQRIVDSVRNTLRVVGEERNKRPGLHQGVLQDTYYPEIIRSAVLDLVLRKPDSPEGKALIKDYLDYQTKKTGSASEAAKRLKEFQESVGSVNEVNRASQFGPLDKAEGNGIPDSWRERNPLVVMDRYGRRVSRRLAYYDNIETDPVMRKALNAHIKEDAEVGDIKLPGGEEVSNIHQDPLVEPVLRDVHGQNLDTDLKFDAADGVIKSLIMGPKTGAVDLTSSQFMSMTRMLPSQVIPAFVHSWTHIKQGITDSFKAGVNRHNIGSFETIQGGQFDVVNSLHMFRDIMNRVQGRSMLEAITRGNVFEMGRYLAMDNLYAIAKGQRSETRLRFMNDFAPKGWTSYIKQGEFPPEILSQVAAKFVESQQGTYDYRGLPAQAITGKASPFLSLARWNIERTNNYIKEVVNPALNGHYTPLLMSVFGMAAGGLAVTKIREMFDQKKERVPQIKELLDKESQDTKGLWTYKMLALASASSHAGMLADMGKSIMDMKYGNKPMSNVNNPLMQSIASNTGLMVDAANAYLEGDMNLSLDTASEFLSRNIQLYRLALNQIGTDTQRKNEGINRGRDLQVFKQLQGETISPADMTKSNPFENKIGKDFRDTQDLKEAQKLVPQMVQRAVRRAGNNTQQAMENVGNLDKGLSVKDFPSMDNNPQEFVKYLNFIQRTQGHSAMDKMLKEYHQQQGLNEAKKSLLPQI